MEKENGKSETTILQEPPQKEKEWNELAPPTTPRINANRNNPAYQYYKKIRPELQEWWEEFSKEMDEAGNFRYRTARAFAKNKTTNTKEQQWIVEMIGYEPEIKPGRLLRIPWLGDWNLRRKTGSYCPDEPVKLAKVLNAVKAKDKAWDAIHSAAPYFAMQMGHCMKLEELLIESFAGQPWKRGEAGNSPDNMGRYRAYMGALREIYDLSEKVLFNFMRTWGINPEKIEVHTQYNVQNIALEAGVTLPEMQSTAVMEPLTDKEMQAVKMAQHLRYLMDNFKLKPPTGLLPPPSEESLTSESKPRPAIKTQ